MAEPIRKTALPVHRRHLSARPHPRPRPIPWVIGEMAPEPIPGKAGKARRAPAAEPEPRPAPLPPTPALPEESALAAPPTPAAPDTARPRSRTLQPVPEKKLRGFLQTALGLHLAAVVWLFVFPSAGQPSGLSDTLLAAAVLLAGGTVLALAAFGRRWR